MDEKDIKREPFFGDVPKVVIALAAAIIAVSALIFLGPRDLAGLLRDTCELWLGAGPPDYRQPLGPIAPYALHVFAHGSWLHLALNMAALFAFGTATARSLGSPWRFLLLFFIASVAGAVTETLLPPRPIGMLGSSSGVFGLIAAATYVYRSRGGRRPALLSRAMLTGLAPWVVLNLVIAAVGGGLIGFGQIAWASHLGGLVAGAVLFPVLDRGPGRS